MAVGVPDSLDAHDRIPRAHLAAEGVAGIGRIHDQAALAQHVDRLRHESPLGVDRVNVEAQRHDRIVIARRIPTSPDR
ncbi:MAG: hypothetical protein AMXMBFR8_05510 [Nevskiales bacterium]